jgi:hypothetical protein
MMCSALDIALPNPEQIIGYGLSKRDLSLRASRNMLDRFVPTHTLWHSNCLSISVARDEPLMEREESYCVHVTFNVI